MASGFATAVAQGVLRKLGEIAAQQVLNEASLLLNIKEDFKSLQKKFSRLCGYLQGADNQSVHNAPVKEWLADVRDIALDAQDIIDECVVEHLYRNSSQACVGGCKQLIFNCKMGKRIRELKARVGSVIQDGEHLRLFHDVSRLDQPSTSGTSNPRGAQLRRGSVILEEDPRVVGVDEKADEMHRWLDQPAVCVVAVVHPLRCIFQRFFRP